MKLNLGIKDKLIRKVNRQLELEGGRVSYNRVHKNKKAYDRKENKHFVKKVLVDS